MAVTKEAIVIILDVGKRSDRIVSSESLVTFLEKEKECCRKILQRKIFTSKKDEIALLFMGTKSSDNHLREEMGGDCYENIIEAHPMEIPTWKMVRALEKDSSYQGADSDWLDAVIVAMDILRRESGSKKFGNLKIVLFTTFSTYVNDDNISSVIHGLKTMNIELIVIRDEVELDAKIKKEDTENGPCCGLFSQSENRSETQIQSELLAQRVIEETDGWLCNFDFALHHLMNFQRKKARPWYWYCALEIGSQISIQIAASILVKQESYFKWNTESAREGVICRKEVEYFKEGQKIEPDRADLIEGYMVCSTPIQYDVSLGAQSMGGQKCLKCITFCNKADVPSRFWTGTGTYIVTPTKNRPASQRMFFALVQTMTTMNMVMVARRVYANGYKPKMSLLVPTVRAECPCLLMYEMLYADQLTRWYFPLLETKKTQPSQEQYEAVDSLIDSLDLMTAIESTEKGTAGESREAFPHRHLMNISLQYIYEAVTKRAINRDAEVKPLDDRLLEVLKRPASLDEKSAEPLEKIKKLFNLEPKVKTDIAALTRRLGAIPSQPPNDLHQLDVPVIVKKKEVILVGTVTPSEDFLALLGQGEHIKETASQIELAISELMFRSLVDQAGKVAQAMQTYREEAKSIAPHVYNAWIRDFKNNLLDHNKVDFWKSIVIGNQLGLISSSESELEMDITDDVASEFYVVGAAQQTETEHRIEDENTDNLFDEM